MSAAIRAQPLDGQRVAVVSQRNLVATLPIRRQSPKVKVVVTDRLETEELTSVDSSSRQPDRTLARDYAGESWLDSARGAKRAVERKLGRLAGPLMFLAVGGTGMVVDLSAFTLLMRVLPVGGARAVAIGVAMTWNFWLNRRLTFSASRSSAALPQYVRFCLSCTVGAAINWTVSILTTAIWTELTPQVSAFFGIVAGTGFNYVLSKRLVFRISENRR